MPFQKGHKLSVGHGRPKGRGPSLSEQLRMLLKRKQPGGRVYSEAVIEKLVTSAVNGDMFAIREVFDRTEGKPAQTLQGDPSKPLELRITVAYEERIPRRSQETS